MASPRASQLFPIFSRPPRMVSPSAMRFGTAHRIGGALVPPEAAPAGAGRGGGASLPLPRPRCVLVTGSWRLLAAALLPPWLDQVAEGVPVLVPAPIVLATGPDLPIRGDDDVRGPVGVRVIPRADGKDPLPA